MRTTLALVAAAGAALLLGAAPAGATNECRGFQVCVPVAGPWVVLPTAKTVPRAKVEYQLRCPLGYVVGGLDAELTDRAVDVQFLGAVGTPVNPGISTTRTVVVVGTYVGSASGAQTFRPHAGCIPASGGGRRVPTSARQVVPPAQPTVRRVRTARIPAGGARAVSVSCAADERLVDAAHAIGFFTRTPPTERLVAAARASLRIRGDRVSVAARGGAALAGVRAVVQVQAVCAGGGR